MLKTQYQSKNGHFLLQPISEVNVAWEYLLTQIEFDTNWKLYFIHVQMILVLCLEMFPSKFKLATIKL
jgi:hypothetical protein